LYRFKREFRALVDVRHPNLIELYELFSEDQLWFFTMELVRGVNFLEYVRHRHGIRGDDRPCGLQPRAIPSCVFGAFRRDCGPAFAGHSPPGHQAGNVLVSANGRVRLLDFGLVHEAEISNAQASCSLARRPIWRRNSSRFPHRVQPPIGTALV
jgi:serine/threonine protein kinase